ncbi:hypothetical protein N7494_000900 [Penicillium frequentans]|uniref:Uncharacterized protein n=1 Tax=Penicillium frequentans TaxID=3151616 RepID=A0AAD6GLE7_9EURO|nr:hypothetical protein N7494_000900 [Penicillium glabrum]
MEASRENSTVEFENLPEKGDKKFRDVVQPPRSETPFYRAATLQSDNKKQPRQTTTRHHAPYVSFGDRGTTASAGAYGSLLRLCRPLSSDHLQSGILGLGLPDDPEAWYVYWRSSQFLENAQLMANGFGLQILNAASSRPPSVEFVRDRWPVISYSTNEGFMVTVRLWCQNNLVVQQTQITNEFLSFEPLNMKLNPNFHMQDLDYLEKRKNLQIDYLRAPHGYGMVAMENSPDLRAEKERMCVLIGMFKDGAAQELNLQKEGRAIKPVPITHNFTKGNSVEIAVAFKIQMSTAKEDWRNFILSSTDLKFDPQPESVPTTKPSASNPEVNWLLRRNLEHILSVCSIPTAEQPNLDHDSSSVPVTLENDRPVIKPTTPNQKDDTPLYRTAAQDQESLKSDSELGPEPRTEVQGPMITLSAPDGKEDILHRSASKQDHIGPIALTCGDFGDHRMHGVLSDAPELCENIHTTCKGHLEWISQLSSDEARSSNISIHGRIMNQSEETDLPPDGPMNMPSHIIKATEYLRVFVDIEDLLSVCSWLGDFAVKWFRQLVETKNHLTPTWQHLDDSELPLYRLSDHVWIWKALNNLEHLIQHVKGTLEKMPHETLKDFLRIADHLPHRGARKSTSGPMLNFTAEELRRQNLRRFTLENDVLRKRMLSVTRTSRETRFLFHSRDTILYYGLDWGFFKGEEEIWKQLVSAQVLHDEGNDETQWDNPLRYGLAMEMAKQGHQLERSFTPTEMFTHATQIILNSSSENGLFPGQLDDFSKEPVLFDRELFRDFYFHVGFEIPYIILRTIVKVKPDQPRATGEADIDPGSSRAGPRIPLVSQQVLPSQGQPTDLYPIPDTNFTAVQGYIDFQADGRAVAVQRTLKRQVPYGRLVDLGNIVDVPEEWVYKYPDFLDFTPPATKQEFDSIQKEAHGVIQKTLKDRDFRRIVENYQTSSISTRASDCYATVDDIRRGRKQRKWSVEEKSMSSECPTYIDLWNRLRESRSAETSKKRLIYLRAPDYTVATMCYLASPELERVHMAQFFDRHAKVHANYFYDDTAAVVNSWVTEVHFRFFQLYRPSGDETLPTDPYCVRQLKSQECGVFSSDTYLIDAVISFRIVGDFFDRYWTCHIIQNFADATELAKYPPLDDYNRSQSANWQQRKVLELVFINLILKKVSSSMGLILRRIEQGPRSSTSDAGEKYFSRDSFEDRKPGELREIFQLLVILKDNITNLQGLIEQWNFRESSQGRSRPRWTRMDEQKYRKSIKQKLVHFEDYVREIKATAARIEFLIALVTNAQDAIRSKKSLKEAENITLFTYVTVFFLPVGLAVSIFSMSNAPDHSVLVYMIATAAVALLITIGVLWCVLSHLIPTKLQIIRTGLKRTRGPPTMPEETHPLADETPYNQRFMRRLSMRSKDHRKAGRKVDDPEGQTGPEIDINSLRAKWTYNY